MTGRWSFVLELQRKNGVRSSVIPLMLTWPIKELGFWHRMQFTSRNMHQIEGMVFFVTWPQQEHSHQSMSFAIKIRRQMAHVKRLQKTHIVWLLIRIRPWKRQKKLRLNAFAASVININRHNWPNKKSTNWWGRQNATPLKFNPKPHEASFSAISSNFEKCRPEVADDVISSVAVD